MREPKIQGSAEVRARRLAWLGRRPYEAEVRGSSPRGPTKILKTDSKDKDLKNALITSRINACRQLVDIIEHVEPQVIGLGTGRTIKTCIKVLFENEIVPQKYTYVFSSIDTLLFMKNMFTGIRIELNGQPDIYIDSADEVDINLNMIKGGGGALLREKTLSKHSKYNVFVIDYAKYVKHIGTYSPIPIEVVPYSINYVVEELKKRKIAYTLRFSKTRMGPTITDNNNYIIDIYLNKPFNPRELDKQLKSITGVVETGIFYDIADTLIIGYPNHAVIIENNRRKNN